MKLQFALFTLLLVFAGCQPRSSSTHAKKQTDAAKQTVKATDTNAIDIGDFMESLISKENILIDTGWYKYWDSTEIGIPQWGDNPDDFVKFPFRDIVLSYHMQVFKNGSSGNTWFMLDKQKLLDTIGSSDDNFSSNIYKFSYHGHRYLSLTGNFRHYNGYGDRICFNYFFDLRKNKAVMDVYRNAWGSDMPLLYGDLNNDDQLDRIKFDGVMMPTTDTMPQVFRIDAETYKDHKWQPLKDENNQPYFIELYCDGMMENPRLKQAHWMRALPRL